MSAFYNSVYSPFTAESEANAAAMAQPCEQLPGGAGVEIKAVVPEGCGALQSQTAGVTMGGWRSTTRITCEGQVGGHSSTVKITIAATATQGEIRRWGWGNTDPRACLRATSGVALAGLWPAVALQVASARLRDADDKFVLSQREWEATAALIRSAIHATAGVPRALRPYIRWFMAIDPSFWARKGFAEAGYKSAETPASGVMGTTGSVRAFFARELKTAVEAVLGACVPPTVPYSSAIYNAYQAELKRLEDLYNTLGCKITGETSPAAAEALQRAWPAEKQAACKKAMADKSALRRARERDHADDCAKEAAYASPDTRMPCRDGKIVWSDADRMGWGQTNTLFLKMPNKEQLVTLDAAQRAAVVSFAGRLATDAQAAVYRDFVAVYAAVLRVGTAVITARDPSSLKRGLYSQGEYDKFIFLASDTPAADAALLILWQKLASAHAYVDDEHGDIGQPVIKARWKAAVDALAAARAGLSPTLMALTNHFAASSPATTVGIMISTYSRDFLPPHKQECDTELSARMSDWLAYAAPGVGAVNVYQIVFAQIIRLALEASPQHDGPPAMALLDMSVEGKACTSRLGRTDLATLGARVVAELDKLPLGATFTPTLV